MRLEKNTGFCLIQQTPPPKDSQFSAPIRTSVNVLIGREAPGKFSLLWDSVILFILGFLKTKEEKNFVLRKKQKKKKKFLDFIPRGCPYREFSLYAPQLGRQSMFFECGN